MPGGDSLGEGRVKGICFGVCTIILQFTAEEEAGVQAREFVHFVMVDLVLGP
jgi:hypothetical protein